jgi:peptide/nickel transport system substrate-binding protein
MLLRKRNVQRLVALAIAASFAVAACGGSDDDAGGADTTTRPETTVAATTTEPPEDDAFDPDGVLRFMYNNSPGTLNPHIVNTAFANVPLFLIFDRLVHVNPQGDPIPGLATEWEFSSDGLALTFTLREGVLFHDGTSFDAEAVKANIEHALTAEGSFVRSELRAVESVDILGPLSVRLNLSTADVGLPLKLSDRAGAMVSPANLASGESGEKPVGAGMYEIDGEYEVGVRLRVKRFDSYWDPSVQKMAGAEIIFNTDTTAALNAVRSGVADAGLIREAEIDPALSAGLEVIWGYDQGFANINLNPANVPALGDPNVRLAMNLGIDRQAIVEGLLFGYGRPTNQPFPAGYFAHSPTAPMYDFDPEEARRLLTEAGYPDGFDLKLTSVPTPASVRVAEAIASQLEDIGIRVEVEVVEAAVLGSMITVEQTTQAVSLRWTGRPDPTSTIALLYMPGGSQNPNGFVTDRALELFEAQQVEPDLAKRTQLLRELMDEFVANPPATQISLFETVSATVHTAEVLGLQAWITGKVEFRGVGMAKK